MGGDFDKKDSVKLVRLNFWVESISPEKSLQRSILYLCKIILVHVHAYTHTLYTHGWPGNGHCCWKFAANAPLKPTWVEYFQ